MHADHGQLPEVKADSRRGLGLGGKIFYAAGAAVIGLSLALSGLEASARAGEPAAQVMAAETPKPAKAGRPRAQPKAESPASKAGQKANPTAPKVEEAAEAGDVVVVNPKTKWWQYIADPRIIWHKSVGVMVVTGSEVRLTSSDGKRTESFAIKENPTGFEKLAAGSSYIVADPEPAHRGGTLYVGQDGRVRDLLTQIILHRLPATIIILPLTIAMLAARKLYYRVRYNIDIDDLRGGSSSSRDDSSSSSSDSSIPNEPGLLRDLIEKYGREEGERTYREMGYGWYRPGDSREDYSESG